MSPALAALRHHVSGAIARGEKEAVTEQRSAPTVRYNYALGRWYVSTDGGVSWDRTRYNAQNAPKPEYRDSNPKIDLYAEGGRYVGSTNWHRTCRDAFAWFATKHPEKGVIHVQRDNRNR